VSGLDTSGLSISRENIEQLLKVDVNDWKKEIGSIRDHFTKFGDQLPKAIWDELTALETRLSKG
jgi:phosphoenolpyruvate carboxykinase (GTP)